MLVHAIKFYTFSTCKQLTQNNNNQWKPMCVCFFSLLLGPDSMFNWFLRLSVCLFSVSSLLNIAISIEFK